MPPSRGVVPDLDDRVVLVDRIMQVRRQVRPQPQVLEHVAQAGRLVTDRVNAVEKPRLGAVDRVSGKPLGCKRVQVADQPLAFDIMLVHPRAVAQVIDVPLPADDQRLKHVTKLLRRPGVLVDAIELLGRVRPLVLARQKRVPKIIEHRKPPRPLLQQGVDRFKIWRGARPVLQCEESVGKTRDVGRVG